MSPGSSANVVNQFQFGMLPSNYGPAVISFNATNPNPHTPIELILFALSWNISSLKNGHMNFVCRAKCSYLTRRITWTHDHACHSYDRPNNRPNKQAVAPAVDTWLFLILNLSASTFQKCSGAHYMVHLFACIFSFKQIQNCVIRCRRTTNSYTHICSPQLIANIIYTSSTKQQKKLHVSFYMCRI